MLLALEKATGKPVRECFDLIAGTSTGGIIALALVSGHSVTEIEKMYRTLASQVFGSSTLNKIQGVARVAGSLVSAREGSFYDTELLQKFLEDFFVDKSGQLLKLFQPMTEPKAFVVATRVDGQPTPFLFRTYDTCTSFSDSESLGSDSKKVEQKVATTPDFTSMDSVVSLKPEYLFLQRTGTEKDVEDSDSLTIVDACRATSAAPGYFDSAKNKLGQFVDGGLVANNPIELAVQESAAVFPGASIRCIVSLGTGMPAPTKSTDKSVLKYAKMCVHLATSSEEKYTNAALWLKATGMKTHCYRLNPGNGLGNNDLAACDDDTLSLYAAETDAYLTASWKKIQAIAKLVKRE